MRENKSKGKSVKASKSNRPRSRTPTQLKKDAARILDIMNSAEVSNEIKYEIGCLIIEHVDAANLVERHAELFAECYVVRAKDSGDERAQRELERILNRLDAGDQLADVVVMTEARMKRQAQENRGPNFADLSRHLSGVLNDPQTPVDVYNALADQVTDLCNPYLQAIHETAPFIEKALIFVATGEAESTPTAKTDAQQWAELARLIHTLINHPKMSHDLRESIFEGLVTVQNDVGAREITESLQGIRATLEQYERKGDRGNDTTDLLPRNKREQAIVDDVLEHAEEIRAARAACDSRAKAIGNGGAE